MRTRSFCFSVAASLALLVTAPASATPNFPPAIQSTLQLNAAPPCTLCHLTDSGGKGTVVTPFGRLMMQRGLVEEDETALKTALMAVEAEGKDSDGDGVGDIAELRAGTDPNTPPGGEASIPAYGCGAQVSPGRALPNAGLVLLAAAVTIGLRRRARSTGRANSK
ncbi:thrombospondin type 3 repeat-containing protein [Pendulispora albinea]|uniref:Thrombospondin type 3 repeat-containing protein n=1 Tax=Pendulispora albinea TaxID=2741071 RepID=A0ABZ2MAK1_9BACT